MWGLLIFLAGLLYGWMAPPPQDKGRLLWHGVVVGLMAALVVALLGAALASQPLPLGGGIAGMALTILVLTVVFAAGAWLGDVLEGVGRTRTRTV